MKIIIALFAIIALSACSSTYNYPKQEGKDICLQNSLEIYPGYFMKKGRHKLLKNAISINVYGTENLYGKIYGVHSVTTFRLSDEKTLVCLKEFTHEFCAEVVNLNYCEN